jgi:hypothetical protein
MKDEIIRIYKKVAVTDFKAVFRSCLNELKKAIRNIKVGDHQVENRSWDFLNKTQTYNNATEVFDKPS